MSAFFIPVVFISIAETRSIASVLNRAQYRSLDSLQLGPNQLKTIPRHNNDRGIF